MPDASRPPAVSIGMPVYNGADYVAEAIESVLAQSFGDFELIVADNASTDATAAIAARYAEADPRVRLIRHEANLGGAPNFNFVFGEARAPLFKWAAHDDVLEPDYLSETTALLARRPDAVIAHCASAVIDETGTRLAGPDPRRLDGPSPSARIRRLVRMGYFTELFGLFRADALARTRLMGRHVSADRVLMAELLMLGDVAYAERCLFLRRDHAAAYVRQSNDPLAQAKWFDVRAKRGRRNRWLKRSARLIGAVAAAPIPPLEKARATGGILAWHGRVVVGGLLGPARRGGPAPR
ncbi:MAG: glycosyltransferase family 2 protein [Azospirillaceae bacterium]